MDKKDILHRLSLWISPLESSCPECAVDIKEAIVEIQTLRAMIQEMRERLTKRSE